MKRTVSVTVNSLAWEALESVDTLESVEPPVRLASAVRVYLDDKGRGRHGWEYPAFLAGAGDGTAHVTVPLEIEAEVWDAFEREAREQEVETDELVSQASLYLAAEAEAGRLVPRLLEGEQDGADEAP